MSQTFEPRHLPSSLRALQVGQDDAAHIRRMVHLAAAKIEDLQDQVTRLLTALDIAGGDAWRTAGRARTARPARNSDARG